MKSNNKCIAHYRLKKKKGVNQISNGHTQNDLKHHHHQEAFITIKLSSSFCLFFSPQHASVVAAVAVVVVVAVAVAGDPGHTLALRVHVLYLRLLSYPHSKG